jgi:hypothetical protein
VLVDELIALANEKSGVFWQASGRMQNGWLLAMTGKNTDAVHILASGITAYDATAGKVYRPLFMSCLASVYLELSNFDDSLRCIGEAITAVKTTKERLWEAEVHRVASEIALRSSGIGN